MIRALSILGGLALGGMALTVPPAAAAPTHYVLDPGASSVGFAVDFGPDRILGILPVATADIVLDFDNAPDSHVAITLDALNATASFPFATQALRSPKILDTRHNPTITFATTDLHADGRRARVRGDLTIRGVTRPVLLDAQIFRQQGSAGGDLSRLSVHLTGAVRRSDFGAIGWSDMVGDTVSLDIRVRINRAE